MSFYASQACQSRSHCLACRSSANWRRSNLTIYPELGRIDFDCPVGLPITQDEESTAIAAGLALLDARTHRRLERCDECPHQVLLEATCVYPDGAPSCDRIRSRAGGVCRAEFERRLRSGDGPPDCPWKYLRPPFE